MKLYGGRLSPFVMRPVLVARAKGHELEPEIFEGGIKCPEYLALSPLGKMPLLIDGDFALPESQVIAEYLDAVLDGPPMVPADARQAARVRLLVRLVDTYIIPHVGGVFRARDEPQGLAPAKAAIGEALGHIEHFRDAGDSFAVGGSFSFADAALIPLFFFFDAFDRAMQTGALIADRPGLAAWWARAKASDIGARCIVEQSAALKAFNQ